METNSTDWDVNVATTLGLLDGVIEEATEEDYEDIDKFARSVEGEAS